jgi:hypothetical protein
MNIKYKEYLHYSIMVLIDYSIEYKSKILCKSLYLLIKKIVFKIPTQF